MSMFVNIHLYGSLPCCVCVFVCVFGVCMCAYEIKSLSIGLTKDGIKQKGTVDVFTISNSC